MLGRSQWSPLLALVLVVSGCGALAPLRANEPPRAPFVGAAHNDTSTPFNLSSLPALVRHTYDGRALDVGPVTTEGVGWVRRPVSYRSGDLRISGMLTLPRRPGRWPLVVVAHGYKDPAAYEIGVALAREQVHLATRGYAVLLPDYRNHGDSDREGDQPVARPLGYAEDVVNAVRAVRRAGLAYIDASRVGLLGRSMGGGVALNAVVARPGLVDALVLSSPVSSRAADNYRRWVHGRGGALDDRVRNTYGLPAENPRFWARASARNYSHRIDVPVQVHHGTADLVCPIEWSEATVTALQRAGQTAELHRYPGQGHQIHDGWHAMMSRITGFFDQHV